MRHFTSSALQPRSRPGVLILARIEEKVFTQDEVDFLMRTANQLALAVENALSYREIASLKDKLAQEKAVSRR